MERRRGWVAAGAVAVAFVIILGAAGGADSPLPAFPGAEGFGAYTPGGRGGKVLLVTNLNDSGPGSLRAALEAQGPRIVVFRVSGIIDLKRRLEINNPFITVAGQSAPGGGICIKRFPMKIETHDVILRYLRIRPGDEAKEEMDGLWVARGRDVIVDHCSVSWAIDEVLSTNKDCKSVTVQWTMITESLNKSYHGKGEHGYGSLVSSWDGGLTYHHNVYAHHKSRNPRAGSTAGQPGMTLDFRNNLIYDWGMTCGYNGQGERVRINYVANYLKPGPSTRRPNHGYAFNPGSLFTTLYLADNFFNGYPDRTKDNWLMIRPPGHYNRSALRHIRADQPFAAPPVRTDSAQLACRRILAECGASLPVRDAVDARIAEEIRAGTGRIIDSQADVGGWPEYRSAEPPADSDLDGMPDAWEAAHGLNPNDPSDAAALSQNGSGYTHIEEYLNGIDQRNAEQS